MLSLSMEQDRIIELTLELVQHIRQPKYLYGSRRWGWCSWIKGDLELECSSSRMEYRHYSISHPEFLIDYLDPTVYRANYWDPHRYRVDEEQLWFEGDIEALEREVIWLRLSA
jgi:hypothetical protein